MLCRNTLPLLALLLVAAQRGWAAAVLTDAQKPQMTDAQNQCRRDVNPTANYMHKLVYNDTLANVAQSYAAKCNYAHNPDNGGTGENICYQTTLDLKACATAWCDERIDYNYASGTCAAGKVCGHYTQVVWADTVSYGCATQFCATLQVPNGVNINNVNMVVCNYSPAGNIRDANGVDLKPYKDGTPCSSCSGTCDNKLCEGTKTGSDSGTVGGSGAPGIKSGPVTLFTAFLLAGLPLLAF